MNISPFAPFGMVLLDPDGEVQELAAYGYVGTPPGLASCAGGVSKQKSVAQVPSPHI
jgi:hypothetical protein